MGLFNRKPPPQPPAKPRLSPEVAANFLSKLLFQWVSPILSLGYQRPLEKEDLDVLGDSSLAHNLTERFNSKWAYQRTQPKPSLLRALNATFGWRFWASGLLKVIGDSLLVIGPGIILKDMLAFISQARSSPDQDPGRGYMLATVLFLFSVVSTICVHQFWQLSTVVGFSARTVLIATIYRKSLVLSGKARQIFSTGKITNLMSTDTTRIDFVSGYFHIIWAAPIQILLSVALLITNMGPSALAGFGIMVIFGPLQTWVMRTLVNVRKKAVAITDSRVKLTQEMLNGVKVIKFYGWEESFLNQLEKLRSLELRYVRKLLVVRAGMSGVAQVVPIFATILAFVTYSLTGHTLDPAIVFSSMALFNILRMPLMMLPMIIGSVVDAKISIARIQEILLAEELDNLPPVNPSASDAITVQDGDFLWESLPPHAADADKKSKKERKVEAKAEAATAAKEQQAEEDKDTVSSLDNTILTESKKASPEFEVREEPFLKDINLRIPRGSLTAIVGAVGSGKSSLLNALVGEMRRVHGKVEFGGSVGYCPQTAWIQNATLKENVLFGRHYDEKRYRRVISDCALVHDLTILPGGDETEIGERGINLSGGQKQRINLARAYYYDADIVLLDDPLSAVDAHVGKHLFEKCILDALSRKTRVLVTHQLHYVPRADYIVVMVDGRIAEQGTFEELMAAGNAFAALMQEYGGINEIVEPKKGEIEEIEARPDKEMDEAVAVTVPNKVLMSIEERNTGSVEWNVYGAYVKAAGGMFIVPLLLLMLILSTVGNIMTSKWMSWWSEGSFNLTPGQWMGIYTGLGGIQAVFTFFLGFIFSAAGARAAQTLQRLAIESVFRAPMSFFDTTPLGRIINRFSKDVDAVDNLLSESYRMFFFTMFAAFGTFALICVIFPLFLAPLVPLLVLYYFAALYYRSTSRELKRLDSVLRSALYAHFGETLTGLATIRAYREQDYFITNNENFTDLENRAYYLTLAIQRWLGVRLETIANVLIFMVSILSVAFRLENTSASLGFVLSYAMTVTMTFNWAVRQSAEVETNMNSVERLHYYATQVEHEADVIIPDRRPASDWPSKGEIQIRDMEVRYREGLPSVLHGVNLDIKGGEKIGVVGRTGSGKSTIMIALFRLVELSRGSITIDGVDVSKLGLHDLRTRIAIIPQDPVLFQGSIRTNLDPFGRQTDGELWDVLERSDLKTYVKNSPGGLDSNVAEAGENLSVGQRQLLCLARAMLAKAKVIIMDEATASVDVRTDALLQKALRVDFAGCTILTIAHRLNTIVDYDRILVLDNGRVKEFDSPSSLLDSPDSAFSKMVDETGESNARLLRQIAKTAAEGGLNIADIEKLVAAEVPPSSTGLIFDPLPLPGSGDTQDQR